MNLLGEIRSNLYRIGKDDAELCVNSRRYLTPTPVNGSNPFSVRPVASQAIQASPAHFDDGLVRKWDYLERNSREMDGIRVLDQSGTVDGWIATDGWK